MKLLRSGVRNEYRLAYGNNSAWSICFNRLCDLGDGKMTDYEKLAREILENIEKCMFDLPRTTSKCECSEIIAQALKQSAEDALSRAVIRWPTQEEIERYWDLTIYIGPEEFSAARRYEFEHGLHVAQKNARIEVKE